MVNGINKDEVLALFSGKAREAAEEGLKLLAASVVEEEWLPGASKRCRSVLSSSKMNVAAKVAGVFKRKNGRPEYGNPMRAAYDACRLGYLSRELVSDGSPEGDALLAMAKRVAAVDEKLRAEMDKLDGRRPKPRFVVGQELSPLVAGHLKSLGAVSVEVCPMRFERVEKEINGKKVSVAVAILEWPEGIEHGASRFCKSGQCQACGHAIRNAFNWVPLVLRRGDKRPASLWVGRDCAGNMFNIGVSGEVVIEGARDGLNA